MLPMGGNYSDSSLSHVMSQLTATGRLHSMASGSFRDAKLERPVSGAELRRLLVASRPNPAVQTGEPTMTASRVDQPSLP